VISAADERRDERRIEPEVPYERSPAPRLAEPPPVLAERPAYAERERSGIVGKLALVLALVGIGAIAWYYQEPLRDGAASLMTAVDSAMEQDSTPAPATPEAAPASPDAPQQEPLAQAPPVTDQAPASVVAPGASVPPSPGAEPAAPQPAPAAPEPAPATRDSYASSASSVTPENAPVPQEQAPAMAAVPSPAPAAAGPAHFSFVAPVTTVRESDVAARIVIRRSGDASGTASIAWWTGEDSALADADYADLGARIEQFAPGEMLRTVFVPLTNDTVAEPAKSFNVYLGRGESGEPDSGTRVEIVDDD
jgi:Calx-beta domain